MAAAMVSGSHKSFLATCFREGNGGSRDCLVALRTRLNLSCLSENIFINKDRSGGLRFDGEVEAPLGADIESKNSEDESYESKESNDNDDDHPHPCSSANQIQMKSAQDQQGEIETEANQVDEHVAELEELFNKEDQEDDNSEEIDIIKELMDEDKFND